MQTYLFYDIETTGLSPDFDQVLQFAAIRTDVDLNEISRHQFYVRLSPDRVPCYPAVATHKITPSMLESGMNEYDAIRHIHALMNQPQTCSIGYNTLAFDDNFLRFSFHRFMLDPYTHQYANGCCRADLFLMILPFYNFFRDSLVWPEPLSLKLENLAPAQGIEIGAAHDAMNDVLATLELAKILKQHARHWDYVIGLFDKSTEATVKPFSHSLFLSPKFGYDNHFIAPVIVLGQHSIYKHRFLWRLDDDALLEGSLENIRFIKKKPGEQGFYWPASDKYLSVMTQERHQAYLKSLDWCLANKQEIMDYIKPILHEPYPLIPNLDVDSAIYQLGFKSRELKSLSSLFHVADRAEKQRLINDFPEPYKEQAVRVLWRTFGAVPDQYQFYIDEYRELLKTGLKNHIGVMQEGLDSRMDDFRQQNDELAKNWLNFLQHQF